MRVASGEIVASLVVVLRNDRRESFGRFMMTLAVKPIATLSAPYALSFAAGGSPEHYGAIWTAQVDQ